jgi:hypothetical protein
MKALIIPPVNNPGLTYSLSGPIWLNDQGIVVVVPGNEPEHTLEHAKSYIECFEKICGGIPKPVLADFTNVNAMSREAREFYTGEKHMKKILALGIVSASQKGRFVANFFIGVNLKTEIPIRICDVVETAILWLQQFDRYHLKK